MTTKDVRDIMASFGIKTAGLEYKNDYIAEDFIIRSPIGSPHKFTISHKGTPVSMANAFNSYISTAIVSGPESCRESVIMQMHDASDAVRSAIRNKQA